MNRIVYLSPLVLALGLMACQKRDAAAPVAPTSPGTAAPSGMTTPGAGASAPSMAGSEPMAPATGASQ
jgi:hypothetical protein